MNTFLIWYNNNFRSCSDLLHMFLGDWIFATNTVYRKNSFCSSSGDIFYSGFLHLQTWRFCSEYTYALVNKYEIQRRSRGSYCTKLFLLHFVQNAHMWVEGSYAQNCQIYCYFYIYHWTDLYTDYPVVQYLLLRKYLFTLSVNLVSYCLADWCPASRCSLTMWAES